MENLFQRLEKNWDLCLLDEKIKKKSLNNRQNSLIKVIVCVSGGCDSVALLHLFHKMRKLLFIELHILHFNHQIRIESDQEQIFVKTLAEDLQLPFYFKRNKDFSTNQNVFVNFLTPINCHSKAIGNIFTKSLRSIELILIQFKSLISIDALVASTK